MTDHTYRAEILACGANFAPGALIAEFRYAKNYGYADYINDVPEGFFTVNQDDPRLAFLVGKEDPAHMRIYRDDQLAFSGWLGEHDARADDVVLYGYGYVTALFLLVSGWDIVYTNATIDTIVNDMWTDVTVTQPYSKAAWMTKGVVEAPVTTDGGATAVVLPTYGMYYKNYLTLLREMAILGAGSTKNVVQFRIDQNGQFNFWKNKSTIQPVTYNWSPKGPILDFRDRSGPMFRRNYLRAAGSNPDSVLLRYDAESTTDEAKVGRHTEPMSLSWVRDQTELQQAVNARLQLALTSNVDLSVIMKANAIDPPPFGPWGIGDIIQIQIARGITQLNSPQMVTGYQVLFVKGEEKVHIMTQDQPGV